MAQQTINIGTVANDGTGDPLRTAFDKTNDNFTEVYAGLGVPNDSVTYEKLATEFTNYSSVADSSTITFDFSTATQFAVNLSQNCTIDFSNGEVGTSKDIFILNSADGLTLSFSQATNAIYIMNGEYVGDSGVENVLQVLKGASNTYYVTISQTTLA